MVMCSLLLVEYVERFFYIFPTKLANKLAKANEAFGRWFVRITNCSANQNVF